MAIFNSYVKLPEGNHLDVGKKSLPTNDSCRMDVGFIWVEQSTNDSCRSSSEAKPG